jgi:hypothetical protein
VPNLNAVAEERRRKRELKKCLKSTYYLARTYLGYDRLTEWHEARTRIFDSKRGARYLMWLAPRGHYKTTLVEAEVIRDILEDPNKVHLLTHASGEEVTKNVEGIAWHFTHNKKLRWLRPEIMPPLYDTTFFTKTPSPTFTIKRDKFNKQPTVRGAQAGKEITGSHIDGTIWLDDIVGEKTIKDSTGMNDLRKWYRTTIMNVLMHEAGGKVRARGTRWHLVDIWDDFLQSSDWISMVDACLVNKDGDPDWAGESVLFPREVIEEKLRQMGHVEFAMQMMNDPLTEEMKAWSEKDEIEIDIEDVPDDGMTIVLSDPAPKGTGAVDKTLEKMRGGEGDYWAITAMRIVKKKSMLVRYRLDAIRSRKWTWDEGIDACLDMCEKWGTNRLLIEQGGQTKGMYTLRVKERSRKRGLTIRFIEMKSFSKGKNWRHAQLAGLNKSGELVFVTGIVDEGTDKLQRDECRNHPQVRFDDLMDSMSMVCDPAVIEIGPKASKFIPKIINRLRPNKHKPRKRTRYVY